MDTRPIGVFDSGLGGLTAVKALLRRLPGEDIVYFGDTGRVPYGTRSRETIIEYFRQDSAFLKHMGVKMMIIACGTLSSVVPEEIRNGCGIPTVGIVDGLAEKAASVTRNRRIGVIATTASISSGSYERTIASIDPDIKVLTGACPLLVPLVENGRINKGDIVIETVAEEYLQEIKAFGADTLVLGCTHFPLLWDIISGVMGENTILVDPGEAAVDSAYKMLKTDGLLNPRTDGGEVSYYVTDSVESFVRNGGNFLGRKIIGKVEKITMEQGHLPL